MLIADTLKKSLKIKRDASDTFPCKSTIEILEVMKKNYVLDRNLFLHLFRPIAALRDPVSKYQTQVNCKQVALLLNRVKNQELIEFIREDDVTLFEGKTIMQDRRGVYIQEKEKLRLEGKEKKTSQGIRASTPRATEIGTKLPGVVKDDEEIDLNTSLASIVGIGDDLRNSVGKVALEKKIMFYMEFLDKEIIYLNICLNDDQVLKMLGASNNRNNTNNYAGRIPQKDTHQ